jgi:predicted ArsR family transcriptional regulator
VDPTQGDHPIRDALLELLRTHAELTSTQAARELGGNTGLYSFHLRKLAEQGLVEDVPGSKGRARPWQLAKAGKPTEPTRDEPVEQVDPAVVGLNRSLEDESYQRWLAARDQAPEHWRRDEAFSQVVWLTPEELAGVADVVRSLVEVFRHREGSPTARPRGSAPVAVVARLFPMLDPVPGDVTGPADR